MSLPKQSEPIRSKASIAEVLNTPAQPAAALLNTLRSTSPLVNQPATATTTPAPASTPVNTPTSPAPQTIASATGVPVQLPATTAPPTTPVQADSSNQAAPPASSSPRIVTPVDSVPIVPARPNFAQRPSWIGPPRPDRPVTPGIVDMKQPVIVEYTSKGLQPPVYVCTSLSDPQWSAVEMDSEGKDDGEYRFYKAFQAEEGEYQYKFRLGPGDWWACDESKPLVDDGQGNKNNQVTVKPAQVAPPERTDVQQRNKQQDASVPQTTQPSAALPANLSKPLEAVQAALQPVVEAVKQQDAPVAGQLASLNPAVSMQPQSNPTPAPEAAPLLPHEKVSPAVQPVQRPTSVQMPALDTVEPPFSTPTVETPAAAPLMKHESFAAEKSAADNGDVPPQWEAHDTDERPAEEIADEDDDANDHDDNDHDDDEPDEHASPLLRHESLSPDPQQHAPLMRHESASIGEHYDDGDVFLARKASSTSSAEDSIAPEADPNDPTLEKFPTGKNAILDHIRCVSTGKHADETLDSAHHGPAAVDGFGSPLSSLASVQEDEEEESSQPKINLTKHKERHAGPITPPLTPQELDTIVQRAEDKERAEEVEELMAERIIERQKEASMKERTEEAIAETVQDRGLLGTFMKRMAASPFIILAAAGIVLALAASYWKLWYASEAQ
ncbi:hypothetical protein LTR78_003836 [Recurvomyces mirabilis]|uniref:AMP-activated protein kinase glycogen-binding domain-containing protein n=1 Tax=Recurvomyces mirabilis TaxID=574656 RepID=A0AAE0WQM4_9PEZI|nr:hypothetical protein LTR78_003836 [Recurvomyces mirabilis]KAK5154025.1 hypothetical protein LTS14_007245 [Recurvomyces mirabilis]